MRDPVQLAMDRFDVPEGYESFIFAVPALYVAQADGSLSLKESLSMIANTLRSNLVVFRSKEDKKAFQNFLKEKVRGLLQQRSLPDTEILTEAINTLLYQYPLNEAKAIRQAIYDTCVKVAKASGPLFREKVSAEERRMLDSIFIDIPEPE